MAVNQGEILREYVRKKKVRQVDFARQLGMTRQNLSYHMRKKILDAETVKLLETHGVPILQMSNEASLMNTSQHEKTPDKGFDIPMLVNELIRTKNELVAAKDQVISAKDETIRAKDETVSVHQVYMHLGKSEQQLNAEYLSKLNAQNAELEEKLNILQKTK